MNIRNSSRRLIEVVDKNIALQSRQQAVRPSLCSPRAGRTFAVIQGTITGALFSAAALLLWQPPFAKADPKLLKSAEESNFFSADFVQMLASEPKADLNLTRDAHGRTALHVLISRSHQARTLALLLYGADVNVKDEHGRTPIFEVMDAHDPTWNGDSDQMNLEMLTARGANLNAKADDGLTPLALAARNSDYRKAGFLIAHGAAINPEGVADEMQPLAIARSKADQRMISLLEPPKKEESAPVEAGAKIDPQQISKALIAGDLAAVKKLIDAGWAINERDDKGRTALFRAVEDKRADLVSLLLFAGADPNIADNAGISPLMASVRLLNIDGQRMTGMLLLKGANVHATAKNGTTALTTAAAAGHDIGVLALIAAGASPFEVTPKGSLMLYVTHGPTAGLLKAFGLQPTEKKPETNPVAIMFEAAKRGDVPGVEKALDGGVKPDAKFGGEPTAFDWAVCYGQFEVVDLLLKRGVDVNHQYATSGEHPLHMLASWGDAGGESPRVGAENIEKLLARGANPNIARKDGTTPLMVAAKEGATGPIVEALLNGGADINARNKAGLTALGVARKYGRTEMGSFLESRGAKE